MRAGRDHGSPHGWLCFTIHRVVGVDQIDDIEAANPPRPEAPPDPESIKRGAKMMAEIFDSGLMDETELTFLFEKYDALDVDGNPTECARL